MEVLQYLVKLSVASVVLALIMLAVLLWLRKKGLHPLQGKSLKVVEIVRLGGKSYLAVVEWKNKKMLIAVTEKTVSVLAEEDDGYLDRRNAKFQRESEVEV